MREEEKMEAVNRKGIFLLLLIEAVWIILLLPGCFRRPEILDHNPGDKTELAPGVYEIRIENHLENGQSATVELKSDEAFYRALRTNAVTIGPEDGTVAISAWVIQKTTDAYIQCDISGSSGEGSGTVRVELYRTAKGKRILLALSLLCAALLDGILVFRRGILDGRITKKEQIVFWTLLAGILTAYFPYLTDYLTLNGNTTFYLARIVKLSEGIGRGIGFMAPGDLFLLIPAGLKMLGFSMMTAYRFFLLLLVSATAIIAYHSLYFCVREEYAALLGSMVYLLLPYHLMVLYDRGAVGEYIVMAFLPMIFGGGYSLCISGRDHGKTAKALICTLIGLLAVWSGLAITVKEPDSGVLWQYGAGAFLLLLSYIVWRFGNRKEKAGICDLCMAGNLVVCLMQILKIPGRWMMAGTFLTACLAAFYLIKLAQGQQQNKQRCGTLGIYLVVLSAVFIIFSAVYHVDRIAYTSKAVYLYEARNMPILYQEDNGDGEREGAHDETRAE